MPYLVEMMDAASSPDVSEVVVMAASQVGKTSMVENLIGYMIDQDPSPMLLVLPTLDKAEEFSKERLAPMLRDNPWARGKVRDPRSRDSDSTLLSKSFDGGHLAIAGANSPASLASRPIRLVIADEIDHYTPSAAGQGDPVALARARTATFWNAKTVLLSTPSIKGASRIEQAFERSDQRFYFAGCPDCGHEQTLRWRQVEWDKADDGEHLPETAVYVCEKCSSRWTDAKRRSAIRWGKWKAARPFRGIAGFHVSQLHSSFVPLSKVVADFVEAHDKPELLQAWTNLKLGELWEERLQETVDEGSLLARREQIGPDLPAGVVILTAGVDIQDDRLELEILGWGRGEECWVVGYHVVRGDPSTPLPWRGIDDLLIRPRRRVDGLTLAVSAAGVDVGGHFATAGYAFCREREKRRVWAIRGIGGEGKPIWPRRPSKKNVGKTNLFLVGVDTAKELLAARLRITDRSAPGYIHFGDDLDEEFFAQLTAERVKMTFVRGFRKRTWIKVRARNESLDCTIYAIAAFHGLLAMGLDVEREAQKLDARLVAIETGAPMPVDYRRRVRSKGVEQWP